MVVYTKKIYIMMVLSLFMIVCPSKTYGSTAVETPKMPCVSSVTNHTIKIKWKKSASAKGYYIYQKKDGKYKYIKKVKGVNNCSFKIKGLKKDKTYSYYIRAYSGKKLSDKTYVVSARTTNKKSKVQNITSVNVSVKSTAISKYKTITLKARTKTVSKKKSLSTKVRWISSNSNIASVTQKGVVKGKKTGTCWIYAIAHNGKKAMTKLKVNGVNATKIPILTYHHVIGDKDISNVKVYPSLYVKESDFRAQMKYLHDNGYRTISLDEFKDWYQKKVEYPEKTVVITFDDGYMDVYHHAYPCLKKYGLKATIFLIGIRIQEQSGTFIGLDTIKKVTNEYPNFAFQSHSYNMHHDIKGNHAYKMYSLDEVKEDFKKNSAYGFDYIAYPWGGINYNIITAFIENNMKLGFGYMNKTYARRSDPIYEINRLKVYGTHNFKDFVSKVSYAQ
ncbi:MAG: polysaccharide deacetylase family protein [Anaerostipes sp.]